MIADQKTFKGDPRNKKKGKMKKLEHYSPTSPAVTSIFNLYLFMEKSNQKQKRKC